MALIKSLEILLSAKTGKLDSDLNRALGSLRSFSSRVTGLIGALGGAISLAAVVAGVRRQYERIDDLAKRSAALGIMVRDIQSLELSAGLAGVSLEQLTTGVSRFLRTLGDASQGAVGASAAFRTLRINPRELALMSLPEQLDAISGAFGRLENNTIRAQVAMQLFGRSGLALIPFLNDHSIQDAAKFIEEYQLAISQIDAKKIEQANDTWDILRTVVGDLATKAAIALAPSFIMLGEAITKALKPGSLLRGALEAIGSLVTSLTRVLLGFASLLSTIAGIQASFLGRLIGTVAAFIGFITVLRLTIGTVGMLIKGLSQLKNLLIATQVLQGKAGWAKLALNAGIIAGGILVIDQAIQGAEARMKQFADSTADAAGAFSGLMGRQQQTLNVGTARAGSQEAIAQLFTIKVQGPVVNELQELNTTTQGILNTIREGVGAAGADEEFNL